MATWNSSFNYLAKCPPDLQAEQDEPLESSMRNAEQLFIRFDDQEVRAQVLYPRYKPVDGLGKFY